MTPTSNWTPISIVLVRPIYPRNVGNVARAMGNMSAQQLILIDPQCEIDFEARQGAAGAQTHLMELIKYKSWDEFYKAHDDGIRIAFCARKKKNTDTLDFKSRLGTFKIEQTLSGKGLYLFFGPEDQGLTIDDLEYMNFICTLPVFGQFQSLNLSHAVLLALYITRDQLLDSNPGKGPILHSDTFSSDKFFFPKEVIQDWLAALGFKIGERRTDVYKVLSRILLSNISTAKELRVLESVLFQTLRKLKDKL